MTEFATSVIEAPTSYGSPIAERIHAQLTRIATQGESQIVGFYVDRQYDGILEYAQIPIMDQDTIPMFHQRVFTGAGRLENETLVNYVGDNEEPQGGRLYTEQGTGPIFSELDNIKPDSRSVALVLTTEGGVYYLNGDQGYDMAAVEDTADNRRGAFEVTDETRLHLTIGQPMIIGDRQTEAVETILVLESESNLDEDNVVRVAGSSNPFRQAENILITNEMDQAIPGSTLEPLTPTGEPQPAAVTPSEPASLRHRIGSRLSGRRNRNTSHISEGEVPADNTAHREETTRRRRSLAKLKPGYLAVAAQTVLETRRQEKAMHAPVLTTEEANKKNRRHRIAAAVGAATVFSAALYVEARGVHIELPFTHNEAHTVLPPAHTQHGFAQPIPRITVPSPETVDPRETLTPGSTIEGTVGKYLENNKLANPNQPAIFSEAVFRITSQLLHKSGVTWKGAHHLKPGFRFNMPSVQRIQNIVRTSGYAGKHAS